MVQCSKLDFDLGFLTKYILTPIYHESILKYEFSCIIHLH
jgi:hypothetical protein